MSDLNRLATYLGDVNEARNRLRAVIKAVLTPRQVAHLDAFAAYDEYMSLPWASEEKEKAWAEWRRLRTICQDLDERARAVKSVEEHSGNADLMPRQKVAASHVEMAMNELNAALARCARVGLAVMNPEIVEFQVVGQPYPTIRVHLGCVRPTA